MPGPRKGLAAPLRPWKAREVPCVPGRIGVRVAPPQQTIPRSIPKKRSTITVFGTAVLILAAAGATLFLGTPSNADAPASAFQRG